MGTLHQASDRYYRDDDEGYELTWEHPHPPPPPSDSIHFNQWLLLFFPRWFVCFVLFFKSLSEDAGLDDLQRFTLGGWSLSKSWGRFPSALFHLGCTHPHTCATIRNNQWSNVSESEKTESFCVCSNMYKLHHGQWIKYWIAINLK